MLEKVTQRVAAISAADNQSKPLTFVERNRNTNKTGIMHNNYNPSGVCVEETETKEDPYPHQIYNQKQIQIHSKIKNYY